MQINDCLFFNNSLDKYKRNFSSYNIKGNIVFGMKENFFVKSRNGHLLKDTFDKSKNTLDICSSGLYPANVLSNMAHKPFVFENVECSSIEGFLQSLKVKDFEKQKEICKMLGGSAKKSSKKNSDWLKTQVLYWQGIEYNRQSDKFFNLIKRAFESCYNQNEIFQKALASTKGIKLTHSMGQNDKTKTIFTTDEFIKILNELRDTL